jgi:hypothetical protein
MQNQYIQNAALLTVKADGSYSYRSALKGVVCEYEHDSFLEYSAV